MPPMLGETLRVTVLGAGVLEGRVERVEEVRPMGGLPGMVWRIVVRLPGNARAEAIVVGGCRPAFGDPRYSAAA